MSVHNLVKVYRSKRGAPGVRALDGLSLDVEAGEIFGLLGRNGAGKTTLLRILTTLIRPTSGDVSVNGFNVVRHPLRVREQICAVLQENAVELYLSVADNLATYARFHGIARADAVNRAASAMELFGLGEYRATKVIDLSGGLKRRVQVAKVFMVDRPIVFLDEATTGMDPINKRATLEAIRSQARKGRTIFLTTHLLEEAEELCDRIAIIDQGKCLAVGDLQTIKSLVPSLFEVTITFEAIDDALVTELRALPLVRFARNGTTVELSLRGTETSALSTIGRLAERTPILSMEMRGATLEDVFLELLGSQGNGKGDTGGPQ